LKIYRRVAKDAKGRKVEWVIEKNSVLLRVPLRPLRLYGKHLAVTQRSTPPARRVLVLKRKMEMVAATFLTTDYTD